MRQESLESFKKIHKRQNRELARMLAVYASHVNKLEKEIVALRNENLDLREQIFALKKSDMQQPKENNKHEDENQREESGQTTTIVARVQTRAKARVCYTLPSIKKKLRKGDPFTFGNGENAP